MEYKISSESQNNKYTKSKKGYKCIGPCYNKGTNVVHPKTLNIIHDDNDNFCPVEEYDKNNNLIEYDNCYNVNHNYSSDNKTQSQQLISSDIEFTSKVFLKIFYNIYSFEDGLEWIIEHNISPLTTKIRILKLIIDVYGYDVDMIDNRTVDLFIDLIKKRYMKDYYNRIKKFIYIDKDKDENKVFLKKNVQVDEEDDIKIKINYINEVFIIKNEISKFLMRYFLDNKHKWDERKNHLNYIINEFLLSILNRIRILLHD